MRHCTHFDLYVKKLQNTGCRRLITNARWGSGVELIDLHAPRPTFEELEIGWYACLCGAAGFKTGLLERLKAETMSSVAEVRNCPRCEETDHFCPYQTHSSGERIQPWNPYRFLPIFQPI
jgi:hypothetical protein